MPAEWEPHRATWIAWPHHTPDWPGRFAAIPWCFGEIVRALTPGETVSIVCQSEDARRAQPRLAGVRAGRVRFIGSSRIAVGFATGSHRRGGERPRRAVDWGFNAWAKYANWQHDDVVGAARRA